MTSTSGISLLELIIAVAITGIVMLGVARFLPSAERFVTTTTLRSKANSEARMTMDTLHLLLSHGRPSTLTITTPAGHLPNSDITFIGVDGSSYHISWTPAQLPITSGLAIQPNCAYFSVTSPNGATNIKQLASNVAVFSFSPDTNDPTGILVQFQSETALDNSGKPGNLYRIELPAEIRMEGN